MIVMKKFLVFIAASFVACLLLAGNSSAGNYTVTMPAGQSLTMNDGIDTLNFVITNTACTTAGCNIRTIDFYFPNSGSVIWPEWSTQPPNANWQVTTYSGGSSNRIRFSTTTDGIALNSSRTFSIDVKGTGWGNLPRSASDSFDALSNVVCAGSETFSRSGNLPGWIRRSLAVSMTAFPDIIGIGQSFSLLDQVENRSTSAKNNIVSNPALPTPVYTGGAAVTNTAGPTYNPNPLSLAALNQGTISYVYTADATGTVSFSNSTCATSLTANINTTATTLPVAATAGCASAGTVIIDSEEIRYTGVTANSFTGCTRGLNMAAAAHTSGAVVSGTAGSITTTGATSRAAVSNAVSIGPIAVGITVTPLSLTSGSNVTVTMKVQNTGRTTTLSANIDASTKTIFVASTAAFPSSGTIEIDSEQISCTWKTAISLRNCSRGVNGTSAAVHSAPATVRSIVGYGNIVPTLTASGTATATLVSGPVPAEISSLFSNQSGSFTWVYQITGATGQTYQFQGFITSEGLYTSNTAQSLTGSILPYAVAVTPAVVSAGSATDFTYTYYNGGAANVTSITLQTPSGWTRNSGSPCTPVPAGSNCSSVIRFTAPSPTNDTIYSFYSDLSTGSGYVATVISNVTVTVNRIVVTHAPAGPINADGTTSYTITATLTRSGTPISGATIVFASTAGRLSPTTATTNASGQAVVTLTAPISSTNITATVIATYLKAQGRDTVSFTGVSGPNIQYVGGSLLPLAACKGYNYVFTLRVKNYGTSGITLTSGSYLRFTDGTRIMTAFLDSPATVSAGTTVPLSFGSPTNAGGGGGVMVNAAFLNGSYTPTLSVTDGAITQNRITDTESVQACVPAAGGKVKMLRWREAAQ
jgi:hypothetical protein